MTEFLAPTEAGIARAVTLLTRGAVIAFPTDTVYGLAALVTQPSAVQRVYAIKGRPVDKPLVVMVADEAAIVPFARVDDRARAYIERFWPGPLTLVLPAGPGVGPPLAMGDPAGVGVRRPDHPVAQRLLAAAPAALATTSANPSGEPAATTPAGAALPQVAAVLAAGRSPGGEASTVLDLTAAEPRVLRAGPIPAGSLVGR